MPRRSILSAIEQASIYALPEDISELITRFAFTEQDLTIIKSHRGAANRFGFAAQLAYMRFPGVMLGIDEEPAPVVVRFVSDLLMIDARTWEQYGARGQTRREHLVELQDVYGYRVFTLDHRQQAIDRLVDLAWLTDKGVVLAESMVAELRGRKILLPPLG